MPETWELVSEEVSNLRKSKLIITLFIDKSNSARDVSFLEGHEYNVYIENMISPKRPEAKGEKRFLSIMADEKQEVLDGRIEFMFKQGYGIPKKWKGADFINADLYYDQDDMDNTTENNIGTNPNVPNSTEDGGDWAESNATYGYDNLDWATPGS